MKTKNIVLSSVVIAALSLPAFAGGDLTEPVEETQVVDANVTEEVEEVEETSTLEVSGYLKTEIAAYTQDGQRVNGLDRHDRGDLHKAEGTLKLFINGELGEDTSFHSELQLTSDTKGIEGYEHHRNYTQNDYLRELYIDTAYKGWDFRLGKQQVVWGKADGVKFLDIINPTDFREWGQNTMEDSRIPLWMLVAEKDLGENDSLQLVWVPDVGRINQIPGLYDVNTGDQGQPFVSLGAASITGQRNGFFQIGKEFGKVAGAFDGAFSGVFGMMPGNGILQGFAGMTVNGFTQIPDVSGFLSSQPGADPTRIGLPAVGGPNGAQMLYGVVHRPAPNGIQAKTNLFDGQMNVQHGTQNDIFDYLGDTTFATFNGFIGMNTVYRVNDLSQKLKNHNFGIRYKKGTDFGLNYTLNYYRHWENNPMVNLHWEAANGEELTATPVAGTFNRMGAPVAAGTPGSYQTTTMALQTASGGQYNPSASGPASLVFEQSVDRVDTIGASFDYAIDTPFMPVVLRGEFVYDKGSKVPQVDLGKLAYGDLAGALTMQDADIFKYVIGADVTVGKNLFVSLQFMDTWNLDYTDEQVQYTGNTQSYGKFTANPATLSLTNGFKKAEEHQIMYTLFLSKPFLESDALRVNNLFLYEQEDGGYWNRLDLEYSYADDILLTAEWNKYGGDKNGVFGQFEEMSNIQIGAKYIF
ncbi:MAG: Unknown protein [uncultured Sulfurovum sp.]|uniref:Uncharacterized protein n=1 Tax=uncultured Sulfurovum sp. TaxID=269237 RepID=A0A6S6SZK1_9BACT|nr:MAG: Unknown protein [uncultured Sulfurovum sp.]